jgi:carboxyl-terminal processing protease
MCLPKGDVNPPFGGYGSDDFNVQKKNSGNAFRAPLFEMPFQSTLRSTNYGSQEKTVCAWRMRMYIPHLGDTNLTISTGKKIAVTLIAHRYSKCRCSQLCVRPVTAARRIQFVPPDSYCHPPFGGYRANKSHGSARALALHFCQFSFCDLKSMFHILRRGFALVSLAWLSGCAVLDSHNIIGRMTPPPQTEGPLSAAQRNEVVDLVWSTVNARYIDPKLNGVDWSGVKSAYAPKFAAAKEEEVFWETLDNMVGELGDSHTRIESPARVRDRNAFGGLSYGVTLSNIEGVIVVIGVHNDSDAWFAGVRTGAVVERIGDKPAALALAETIAATRKHSTVRIQERQAFRKLLQAHEKSTVRLAIIRDDGSRMEATLKPRTIRSAPSMASRTLPSGFGYIRFSGFSEGLRSGVLAAIEALKDSPGLIIDLRSNGGGSGAMSRAIVERFMAKETQPLKLSMRDNAPMRLFGYPIVDGTEKFKPALEKAYQKPVVILTDINSASASEMTAAAMREIGNTTVVGQTTCGCLLGYMGYLKLPGGGEMAYSELGFTTASGKRIEGEGVVPDVQVPIALANLRTPRDWTLEAGVKVLQEKTAKSP